MIGHLAVIEMSLHAASVGTARFLLIRCMLLELVTRAPRCHARDTLVILSSRSQVVRRTIFVPKLAMQTDLCFPDALAK